MKKMFQNPASGVRDAQCLGALVALAEDTGSFPSTHVAANNLLVTPVPEALPKLSTDTAFTWYTDTCRQNRTHAHKSFLKN